MNDAEKLTQLKTLLKIDDAASDSELAAYLAFAKMEILAWLYSGDTPEGVADVPARYIPTQIMACVVGFGLSGVEGQSAHSENSINRHFEYSTMVDYIKRNVTPMLGVIS